jgi:hypothetical protein
MSTERAGYPPILEWEDIHESRLLGTMWAISESRWGSPCELTGLPESYEILDELRRLGLIAGGCLEVYECDFATMTGYRITPLGWKFIDLISRERAS